MHIFSLLLFYNCVSFFPHLAFLCLLLTPVHRLPSSICLFSPPLPLRPATSLILFPLSPSDIRVYFPPGRMHDRGAGGTESKWQISLLIPPCISLSLSLSLHLTHCPARGPPQPSFLPPSSEHLPIVSDHIDIQICPGCIPPSPAMKVSSKPPRENEGGLMSPPWFLKHS